MGEKFFAPYKYFQTSDVPKHPMSFFNESRLAQEIGFSV